jgi:hypothetical protein
MAACWSTCVGSAAVGETARGASRRECERRTTFRGAPLRAVSLLTANLARSRTLRGRLREVRGWRKPTFNGGGADVSFVPRDEVRRSVPTNGRVRFMQGPCLHKADISSYGGQTINRLNPHRARSCGDELQGVPIAASPSSCSCPWTEVRTVLAGEESHPFQLCAYVPHA